MAASPAFSLCTLASGSSGNAVYAACEEGALLIDAGVSGKRLAQNLARAGGAVDRIHGLLVTHDHTDHVRGAGIVHRRHGWPLWMSGGTRDRTHARLGKVVEPHCFAGGDTFSVAGFQVTALSTPHDGTEPVVVVLERYDARAAVLTDLGHPFAALEELLPTLDAVILESNHNREMLARGPYPPSLKRRIRSSGGHLANDETGALLRDHAGDRLTTVLLAHLSESNNRPELAYDEVLAAAGDRFRANGVRVEVAPRHTPSNTVQVRRR